MAVLSCGSDWAVISDATGSARGGWTDMPTSLPLSLLAAGSVLAVVAPAETRALLPALVLMAGLAVTRLALARRLLAVVGCAVVGVSWVLCAKVRRESLQRARMEQRTSETLGQQLEDSMALVEGLLLFGQTCSCLLLRLSQELTIMGTSPAQERILWGDLEGCCFLDVLSGTDARHFRALATEAAIYGSPRSMVALLQRGEGNTAVMLTVSAVGKHLRQYLVRICSQQSIAPIHEDSLTQVRLIENSNYQHPWQEHDADRSTGASTPHQELPAWAVLDAQRVSAAWKGLIPN